mmetsp:Transcript_10566/g.15761  ORF Transcript_10566/g.15761 Transcript_10566/m.15761 type:complete len:117 (+) Transcript_10566:1157-1507(+)
MQRLSLIAFSVVTLLIRVMALLSHNQQRERSIHLVAASVQIRASKFTTKKVSRASRRNSSNRTDHAQATSPLATRDSAKKICLLSNGGFNNMCAYKLARMSSFPPCCMYYYNRILG